MKKILCLLVCIVSVFFNALAQSSDSDCHGLNRLYLTVGAGAGLTASVNAVLCSHSIISAGIVHRALLVQGSHKLNEPGVYKTYDVITLAYGMEAALSRSVVLNASIGPSYTVYYEPVNISYSSGGFISGPYYTYDRIQHTLYGVMGDAQLNYFFSRYFGLGIEVFANANSNMNPFGIMLTLSIGQLRR